MEIYLRTSGGKYVCAEAGPMEAASDQPLYHSLLAIEPYDPVRHGRAADPVIRSQALVTLHTPEGLLLAPEPVGAGYRLAVAEPGRAAAPQIGRDVLRIFKPNAPKDAPIEYGDQVVFRFTPQSQPDSSLWISAPASGALVITDTQVPGPAETFQLLLPVDMVDFIASYNDIANAITGEVVLSGPALPGGHIVHIDTPDGLEFVQPAQIIVTEKNRGFKLPLSPAAMELSPCDPREITLHATYPASAAALEERVRLEGDRTQLLGMRVIAAQKPKSRLPVLGKQTIHIEALLSLDPSAQRLEPGNIPMPVKMEADGHYLKNLTQDSNRVTFDRPIKFTFDVQPPPEDSAAICTLITVRYKLNGKLRASQFAALIRPNGIALDPQP